MPPRAGTFVGNVGDLLERYQERLIDRTLVCESGIHGFPQIKEMLEVGFNAFLVGETLAKSNDPEAILKTWCQNVADSS